MTRQSILCHLLILAFCLQAVLGFTVFPLHCRAPPTLAAPRLSESTRLTRHASVDEDNNYARVPRGRRFRRRYEDDDDDDYDEDLEEDVYDEGEFLDDDELYDEDDWMEEEEYELLSDIVVPNQLLDSIDPDGAADRFPELARDPRFWFDMFLFVCFLDFLSLAGPQDMFPDLPFSG